MKMAKKVKIYRTDRGNLSTCIKVNGNNLRVKFISRDNINGYFSTSDQDLQKAMESDYNYGVKFDEFIQEQPQPYDITPFECVPVITVITWQQAKEYMHTSPYNLPLRSLTSPEKIKSAALSNGVTFPNLEK
ncbi:MAG: hypothetical protein RR293_04480 [Bacteroidales bacterium]